MAMPLTARQLATEVENAFDFRSRESMVPMLARLVAMADPKPVDLATLTMEQLRDRRNALHVQLAAVNDRLQDMEQVASHAQQAERDAWLRANPDTSGSLEPSS